MNCLIQFAAREEHRKIRSAGIALTVLALLLVPALIRGEDGGAAIHKPVGFPGPDGAIRTISQKGVIDVTGPFFQSLGTNGRSCGTCHQPSDGMSVSAAHVQARFDLSRGLDPIFRTNDGSNCDHGINVSTLAGRQTAYSLLRTRGLIRIALALPGNRDFEVISLHNPYGCGETDVISMYRRPLPGTNLKFLSTVMWDGRGSSSQAGTTPITSSNYPQSLLDNLAHQAVTATLVHAQGVAPGPTVAQQQAIVALEMSLTTAQSADPGAGNLSALGATGGPEALAQQAFFVGINDPVGLDPTNPIPFNFSTNIFHIFDSWEHAESPQRQAIARGQAIFNTKTFTITSVAGLNEAAFTNNVTVPQSVSSTCGICHDTPNVGGHSVSAPLNIGVADPPGGSNSLDTSYLPVMTICKRPSFNICVVTTDPGRAMVTGKFDDIGKFKGPLLRGLAARAPYFHNGSAQTLEDAVEFYDIRFQIRLTAQEKSDLVAFLRSL